MHMHIQIYVQFQFDSYVIRAVYVAHKHTPKLHGWNNSQNECHLWIIALSKFM